ncbi:hypothetical protein SCLCIDRAFT_1220401 [Scleroderma citrinum Foug A]|uniref:Uncharacterized protein n=1 Tax=Scleroderma citrinum Foug A TaxID=1036808 RepID=A0A0C3D6G3_9AGAM|nr:hypothetical protein SCLCIDRAFT_1220401 [Scleroderma citrinum Foug A]
MVCRSVKSSAAPTGEQREALLTSNLSANLQLLRYKHAYSVNKMAAVFDGAIFHRIGAYVIDT